MKLSLKYGRGVLDLAVPSKHVARHLAFNTQTEFAGDAASMIENALGELECDNFFSKIKDRVVGLLLADATRERTFDAFLPGLAGKLHDAAGLKVFLCTGTHDPKAADNVALANFVQERFRELGIPAQVHVHDAQSPTLEDVGVTSRGTHVAINADAMACDVFLVLANMKVHYFAGYSNPVKYYVPGLASYETARGNHAHTMDERATFGRHPWHPNPGRRKNPLAEDMVEGFRMLIGDREHFAIAVVGSVERPAWIGGGRTEEVAGRAMEVVDRVSGLEVRPSRFLVVSPGGHPHDESLYTSQRALELTRAAVNDGGEVLFLSECANGIGTQAARQNFFEPLRKPLTEVCKRPEGEYVLYSHKAYKFGLYLSGLAKVHMCSALDPKDVEAIHIAPTTSAQAVLDEWVSKAGPDDAITFVDDAAKFALYGSV
ncbi:MAG: nickel-dependent lactate racemase [Planctomycetota bacterium]|jgi:nickel-dependent lactate racemase